MHGGSILSLTLSVILYSVSAIAQPQYTLTEVPIHVEGFEGALGEDGGVVGAVRQGDGTSRPALWRDGQTTTLPVDGIALAHNAAGVNVGLAHFYDGPFARPIEWRPGGQVFFWDVPPGT